MSTFSGLFRKSTDSRSYRHPSIVKLLLDRAIDTERSSPEYYSALKYACAHGSTDLVQSLLDGGADVSSCDDEVALH